MTEDVNIDKIYTRDLEEFSRLSSMLSKSVHDINNPLAVFIGQVSIIELLQKRGQLDEEKMAKILEKFKSSTETLKERIEYLRNFYKVLVNDPHFPGLDNAVRSATYIFENETYLKGINYQVETIPNLQVSIPQNEVFLIVKHLIQNAIESLAINNKDGGDIRVQILESNDVAQIIVEDSGPGLLCDLKLACELGYTTKVNNSGGTGLALVQKILKKHGVTLNYESKPKSKFSISIPIIR